MKRIKVYILLLKTFYKISRDINSSVIFTQYFTQNVLLFENRSEMYCKLFLLAYLDFPNGLPCK